MCVCVCVCVYIYIRGVLKDVITSERVPLGYDFIIPYQFIIPLNISLEKFPVGLRNFSSDFLIKILQ